MAFTSGKTAVYLQDTGSIIICTERVRMCGEMVEAMKANTLRIESMALVYISGQMAEYTKVTGTKENKMEKANIH